MWNILFHFSYADGFLIDAAFKTVNELGELYAERADRKHVFLRMNEQRYEHRFEITIIQIHMLHSYQTICRKAETIYTVFSI